MRASRFGGLLAAVLVATMAAGAVAAGPMSPLYVSNYLDLAAGTMTGLDLVQGVTEKSYPSTFPLSVRMADHGDLAAADSTDSSKSGRFDPKSLLNADAAYLNGPRGSRRSATSDGTYNYRLNYRTGEVIRYDRMWDHPYPIFSVTDDLPGAGWITINPADGSFWLSQWGQADLVAHFSPTGKLLSSFNSGVIGSVGLLFDSTDETLWLGDREKNLYQFDQAGNLIGFSALYAVYGGFGEMVSVESYLYFSPVPEPSGLTLAAIALVSLSAWRWRSARSRRR